MEILQLRYFFESAKNGSFSKTAEKYMVPLSSVSASVKRLEKELGCLLFHRYSNKIELNENGKKLQNSLCIIFNELDNLIDSISPHKNNVCEIKIYIRALRKEITDYIIEYKKNHPDITFKTIFDYTGTHKEDFDIIIDDKLFKYSEYDNFELCSRKIRLKVSANSHLCNKKLKLKQLCNESFISFGELGSTHNMLLEACRREGFTPNFVVQTNDLLCYNKYVEAGIGIGIERYDDKNENINNDNKTKFLDVSDFIARQTVYVFYKEHLSHGIIRDFLDFLKEKSF
ncbi:MAG: LysR family transcriptional regulator [Ruminococcaceae bacterium]|nr:LysR family transcriptional regulator [Oscillospiraceae bacterium]